MTETKLPFDHGAAYERFMGRWTRPVGAIFLDWLAQPPGLRWLDVGCGNGVSAELVVDRCSPAAVAAIDPVAGQIDYARRQPVAQRVDFRVADAQSLPFPDRAYDVVVSSLVINFIPDRPRALSEMRRVTRPGGTVAGCVWDFGAGGDPQRPFPQGLRQIGVNSPPTPGLEDSSLEALAALFRRAGFTDIAVRSIEVTAAFRDFEEFWQSQTPPFTLNGKIIAALQEADRMRLADAVRSLVPGGPDGRIVYSGRANAIKAQVPT